MFVWDLQRDKNHWIVISIDFSCRQLRLGVCEYSAEMDASISVRWILYGKRERLF